MFELIFIKLYMSFVLLFFFQIIDLDYRQPEHLRENLLSILRDGDRLPFGRFGLYFKDLVLKDGEGNSMDIPEEAKEVGFEILARLKSQRYG